MVTKLKNSKCDKTQLATKLKLWQNSNCDKTQVVTSLKLWEKNQKLKCDKTWIVTKLENLNYDNSKTNVTKLQKLKLGQNLEYDKSQFMKTKKTLKESFSKNILTPWQLMRCSLGSVLRFSRCFGVRWGSVIHFWICLREKGVIDKKCIYVYYSLIFW